MICSENTNTALEHFRKLVEKTKIALNDDAKKKIDYYRNRTAQKLEIDVKNIMEMVARGTEYENSIILVSGHTFPDIVAKVNEYRYFGVEVKSTTKDHWQSLGNSVLESCRFDNLERIFLMFGKLGGRNIEFKVRPYEECLSAVHVTHYPRYYIDMELKQNETIFDKINQSYDVVRQLENPVKPFADYYRSQLKDGESLWWLGDDVNESTDIKVKLWRTLRKEQKDELITKALVWFPETITGKSSQKYERYVLWLVTSYGIVSSNVRDEFSAGGKVTFTVHGNRYTNVPKIFERVKVLRNKIYDEILSADDSAISRYWKQKNVMRNDRLSKWIDIVSNINNTIDGRYSVKKLLQDIFAKDTFVEPFVDDNKIAAEKYKAPY